MPEERIEALRKLAEQKPDDTFTRYSLAMALRSAGRYEDAAKEFLELTRTKPDYVPTYLMLGQVLETLNRRLEAIEVYTRGMEVATHARSDHARQKLGEALQSLEGQGE